jgi:hypothetical protein
MGSTVVGSGAGRAYSSWSQTVDDTARAFSTGNVAPASTDSKTHALRVTVTVENGQLRYRYDGNVPTTALGHLLEVSDVLIIEGALNIQSFQAVRTGATNGTLQITAER